MIQIVIVVRKRRRGKKEREEGQERKEIELKEEQERWWLCSDFGIVMPLRIVMMTTQGRRQLQA